MLEPNYHKTIFFVEILLAVKSKKIYLGLSILQISKIVLHEIWYDYMKPKYGEKTKLCYMDTDNFIVYVKTEDIAKDVETKFNLSLI